MQNISLIIPSHNRHHYLDRILDYYSSSTFNIFVADSTDNPYVLKNDYPRCTYLHLPGITLTNKISGTLDLIDTPFVVMCADDDFTIPEAIEQCMEFLQKNDSFTAVMGNCVCYFKSKVFGGNVPFAAMYTDRLSYTISQIDPFERVEDFFKGYRTIFYALHRTSILKEAFEGAGKVITNLFLNEYLTSVMPLIKGKIAELPLLFQVREYAEDSGDKVTQNLDTVFADEQYKAAYDNFLDFQSARIAEFLRKDTPSCRDWLNKTLLGYARSLSSRKNSADKSLIKRIGGVVEVIPLMGKKIVKSYRLFEQSKKLQLFIRSESDRLSLSKISGFINTYENALRPK